MSRKKRPPIPHFGQPIIETHCHLDYLQGQPLEDTLAAAREVGVERMITISVSPQNLATVQQLAQTYPQVYGTQGIHPHEADHWQNHLSGDIAEAIGQSQGKLVAVGEIGLDYHYDHSDRKAQWQAFEAQLALASELDLPVVIHSRDADEDTMAMLRQFESSLGRRGVIHSFTSGPALAEYALSQGWHLGFNGICTFNKAENVRDIMRMTPVERLLLETDAPFLTPDPYRGRENAPCYLPFVAQKMAAVKEVPVEELLSAVYRNSEALFFPASHPS
ncbi:MAG: TatD family deoxyribonuclease [Halomonadaceae bacterium]|nr:MAG: TatD family deoxyribonuclease [Halomonadaceae bacterium]